MEEKGRRQEINENSVLEESRPSLSVNLALLLDCPASAGIVDLFRIDAKQRQGSRNSEQGSYGEYRTVSELVAHVGDKQRGEDVPSSIEGLILSELLVESCSADNSECDRCCCGTQERT